MSGPKPGSGPRMGRVPGGMGVGGGPGFGESMDENSVTQALAGASGSPTIGGSSSSSSQTQNSQTSQLPNVQEEPREVAGVPEEAKRGVGDVWNEVKKFFSANAWLGIDPEVMTPEEQAEAQKFHARYQQLDQEQQGVTKQMYQEKMQKEKMKEEEEKQKKEIEAREKAQSVAMPSSPQKGAVGPGRGKSKKSQAMQRLKQDRTTIGTTQGE